MPDNQFDLRLMREVREYATHLKSVYAARNSMLNEIEEMYLLTWKEEDKVKRTMESVKVTKSPSARNAVLGAIRLLIASDPVFSVPYDINDPDAQTVAEKIEKMANAIWTAAGRVRNDPVHYDVITSMILFGETHTAVTRTSDMVEHARGASKAAQRRAEEIAEVTPYVFDVFDPRTGYPDFGPYGLNAYYREVVTTSGAVLDEFGEAAKPFFPDGNRYQSVTLSHFWDMENRIVWVNGKEQPLLQETHGLPFIPIVVQLGEGSRLFSKPEYQRQPFLYTLWKSGLWQRQNLMLTVLYTMVFAVGANPMFVYQKNDEERHLDFDLSNPAKVVEIMSNESFGPLAKAVIDPSLMQGMDIATELANESTIYPQTLGEPIGTNAPYSMVALLHQAGRLPLLVPQRKSSWGIADAAKMAIQWMRHDGKKAKAGYGNNYAELQPRDIPKRFELEVKLEVSLPQDRLQEANIANMLTQGDNPLVSKRWVRENVLNIGQSEEMTKEIWGERAAELQASIYFADQAALLEQKMNQAMQPEQYQMAPDEQGTPVSPNMGGLPDVMLEGGMQPPMNPFDTGEEMV